MGPIKLFFSKWVLSNGFHQMGYFEWVLFNVFYSNGFNQWVLSHGVLERLHINMRYICNIIFLQQLSEL